MSQHTSTFLKVGRVFVNNAPDKFIVTDKLFGGNVFAVCTDEKTANKIADILNTHEALVEALKTAYQYFNTLANTPDKEGYVIAPDSIERVVLRKMNEAITNAEAL